MVKTPSILALAAGALLLAGAAPAAGQKGVPPTKRQRESLTPLIQLYAERFAPHLASVPYERVEREVRRALTEQVSRLARKQLDDALVRLIALDLGVDTKKGRAAVKKELFAGFGTELLPEELALLDAEFDPAAYTPDLARVAGASPFVVAGRSVEWIHGRVVRHDAAVLEGIREALQPELSSAQVRGMKELAAHYSPLFQEAFGVERRDRGFGKLLAQALTTEDTQRAMLASLTLQRALARPAVRRVYGAKEEADIVATEALVRERVVKELEESGLLGLLAADHRAMGQDPGSYRKVLAERRKRGAGG